MNFRIRLAETVFSIETLYPDTAALCRDYRVDAPLSEREIAQGGEIRITQEDIERERIFSVQEAVLEGAPLPSFTGGELETTAVYRKIADWFSHHDAAVMHGALIALDGEGYLFTAKSGTGKTTHILNWLKCFPGAVVINGDKPIVRLQNGGPVGHGSPWCGKEGMNTNASVPIKAVIFLHRAAQNQIRPCSLKDIFLPVMTAVYRPKDSEGLKRAMSFVLRMNGKTGFYTLGCNRAPESALAAYEGIQASGSNCLDPHPYLK